MKSVHLLPVLLLAMLLQHTAYSQCDVSSAQTPDIVSNNSFSGSDFDWDDGSFALSSNNQYASAGFTLGLFATVQSDYMMLSDFDISIPLAVTICGIEVRIERKASGLGILGASVRDHTVQLVRNGSVVGTNKATTTNWTGSKVTATYGSSSDLWGAAWTTADVNNVNFGLAFSAELRSGAAGLFLSADIDNVTITVYYQHITLAGTKSTFTAKTREQLVELVWETKEEHSIREFAVEHRSETGNWQTIEKIDGINTLSQKKRFVVYDMPKTTNNYYRAKMIDANGTVSHSETVYAKLPERKEFLSVVINSNNKALMFSSSDPIQLCRIICADGRISSFLPPPPGKQFSISSSLLPDGHFIVKAQTRNRQVTRQFYVRK